MTKKPDSPPTTVTVDIISDVICPWCYIGKARLAQALALRPDLRAEIRWRAFQLNPDMPAGGMARQDYLAAKFGGPDGAKKVYGRIAQVLSDEGLPHNLDAVARTPNTLAAHGLIRQASAAGAGGAETQNAVVDALFAAYFVNGEDIGDPAVLTRIAADAGLDAAETQRRLAEGIDRDAAAAEDAQARAMRISGVPSFIFNGRLMVEGAQAPAALSEAMDQAIRVVAENRATADPAGA